MSGRQEDAVKVVAQVASLLNLIAALPHGPDIIELCVANERSALGWQLYCHPFPGAAVQLPHQRGFIDYAKLNRPRVSNRGRSRFWQGFPHFPLMMEMVDW
jgi:hypothetical protein